jgi:hypothetical protein
MNGKVACSPAPTPLFLFLDDNASVKIIIPVSAAWQSYPVSGLDPQLCVASFRKVCHYRQVHLQHLEKSFFVCPSNIVIPA